MDETGSDKVAELRKKWEEQQQEPIQFLRIIEVAADKSFLVTVPFHGVEEVVGFRRWTHEEANRFNLLPFLPKIRNNTPLDEAEQRLYTAFKTEMVYDALADKVRWRNKLEESVIDPLFNTILIASGLTVDQMLTQFIDSDFGYLYGLIWFVYMKKVPSEVACLPEMDVKTVQAWFSKWFERLTKA